MFEVLELAVQAIAVIYVMPSQQRSHRLATTPSS
jgi:hypothetical protein